MHVLCACVDVRTCQFYTKIQKMTRKGPLGKDLHFFIQNDKFKTIF